jgi:hypothetical protein
MPKWIGLIAFTRPDPYLTAVNDGQFHYLYTSAGNLTENLKLRNMELFNVTLKGQSHKKVDEIRAWGGSLGHN